MRRILIVWNMDYAMVKNLLIGGELADVRLYGFNEEPVDLHTEFDGSSTDLLNESEKSRGTVTLCGKYFIYDDLERFSVLAFHDGLLADTADCCLHFSSADNPELKVYCYKDVCLGLAVDDDVESGEVWARLKERADAVISIVRSFSPERQSVVGELYEKYKLPAIVCCGDKLYTFGEERLTARSPLG